MKKLISLLFVLSLILGHSLSLAEGVIILESPDIPTSGSSGTLDDLKVNVPVDLVNRIYTPLKIEIVDRFVQNEDSYNGYYSKSGEEYQYICLWLEVQSLSTSEMMVFNDATVVVVYEGERGTYKFGGFVRQCRDKYEAFFSQDNFRSIGVLLKKDYLFYCVVPNFVAENPGEIRMEIETDGTTMICIIRK